MKSAEAFAALLKQGFSPADALESLPNYNPFNFATVPTRDSVRDEWTNTIPEHAHD